MPRTLAAIISIASLCACSQQNAAELVDRSGNYYGRNGWAENGQPVARYSDNNRAMQDGAVAYKYQSQTQTYGVDAAYDSVQATDIASPATAKTSQPVGASAAPFGKPSAPLEPEASAEAPSASATGQAGEEVAHAAAGPTMFRWPAEGKVISRFGPKTDGMANDGINIAAAEGDPIWAAADGVVAYVGSDIEGYGNLLILRHKDGWMSSYAHAREFLLKKGDIVGQGDVMGYIGNSGSVKTPQLHFSLREGKTPIDPESVLGHSVASATH